MLYSDDDHDDDDDDDDDAVKIQSDCCIKVFIFLAVLQSTYND